MSLVATTLNRTRDGALPYVGGYKVRPPEGGFPRSKHPVVIRHPETGPRNGASSARLLT